MKETRTKDIPCVYLSMRDAAMKHNLGLKWIEEYYPKTTIQKWEKTLEGKTTKELLSEMQ